MSLILNLSQPRIFERVVKSPGCFCLITVSYMVVVLGIEPYTDYSQQLMLGVSTWVFLGLIFAYLSPIERAQATLVVLIATLGEVLGSVLWGVYEYRLGNLPLFVPPGHGIVYLTGLRLSQVWWARRRPRMFVGIAITVVVGWSLLGLVAFERTDVAGAVAAVLLVAFLLRGRAPSVFAGVFFIVALLEIYGTYIGNWTWAEKIPLINVPNGNPPSGIASGYMLFDIAAFTFAPSLLAASTAAWAWSNSFRNRSGAGHLPELGSENLKLDEYSVEMMIAIGKPGDSDNLPEQLKEREFPSGRKKVAEIVSEGEFSFK